MKEYLREEGILIAQQSNSSHQTARRMRKGLPEGIPFPMPKPSEFHKKRLVDMINSAQGSLTLSPLKPSYDGHSSGHFQKFVVPAVLELCTRCRYQHMRIELLFHVVSLICCLEVRFVQ